MGHCGGYQCTNAVEKLLGYKTQKTRPGMESSGEGSIENTTGDYRGRVVRPMNLETSFAAIAKGASVATPKSGAPLLPYEKQL